VKFWKVKTGKFVCAANETSFSHKTSFLLWRNTFQCETKSKKQNVSQNFETFQIPFKKKCLTQKAFQQLVPANFSRLTFQKFLQGEAALDNRAQSFFKTSLLCGGGDYYFAAFIVKVFSFLATSKSIRQVQITKVARTQKDDNPPQIQRRERKSMHQHNSPTYARSAGNKTRTLYFHNRSSKSWL